MGDEIQTLQQVDTLLNNLLRDLDNITARVLTAHFKVRAAIKSAENKLYFPPPDKAEGGSQE